MKAFYDLKVGDYFYILIFTRSDLKIQIEKHNITGISMYSNIIKVFESISHYRGDNTQESTSNFAFIKLSDEFESYAMSGYGDRTIVYVADESAIDEARRFLIYKCIELYKESVMSTEKELQKYKDELSSIKKKYRHVIEID